MRKKGSSETQIRHVFLVPFSGVAVSFPFEIGGKLKTDNVKWEQVSINGMKLFIAASKETRQVAIANEAYIIGS